MVRGLRKESVKRHTFTFFGFFSVDVFFNFSYKKIKEEGKPHRYHTPFILLRFNFYKDRQTSETQTVKERLTLNF
jgi:hypothetical protein